jgi:hypothetical protein
MSMTMAELEKAARGTRGACGHFIQNRGHSGSEIMHICCNCKFGGDFDLFVGEY